MNLSCDGLGNDLSESSDRYLSYAEAGRLIGKDRETIRYHVKQGSIPATEVMEGHRRVYKVRWSDLRNFAKERGLPLRGRRATSTETSDEGTVKSQEEGTGESFAVAIRQELEPVLQEQGRAFTDLSQALGDAREELGTERAKREAAEAEAERLRQELSRNRRGFWARLFGLRKE